MSTSIWQNARDKESPRAVRRPLMTRCIGLIFLGLGFDVAQGDNANERNQGDPVPTVSSENPDRSETGTENGLGTGEATEDSHDARFEPTVDEADSTVRWIDGKRELVKPIPAEEIRSRAKTREETLASVMTRPEARTYTFSVPAPRGQILTRDGRPLAQNRIAYLATVCFPFLGNTVSDKEIIRYAGERIVRANQLLGRSWDLEDDLVVLHYRERRWVPLPFSSVLSGREAEVLRRESIEGLDLLPIYERFYPQAKTLSHVIGYVGQRAPTLSGEIVKDEPYWNACLGVAGLEHSFDDYLRGEPGRINLVFREDGTKSKETILATPKPGNHVVTTIDYTMQTLAESILDESGRRGALVVMDVRSGDVMAIASAPRFDPNLFVPAISREAYKELAENPNKPLFPRAFRASYPPASTFKTASALGILESGAIASTGLVPCPPIWTNGNDTLRNWHGGDEGELTVIEALQRSCNTWFYQVGAKAGAGPINYMATRLGLGQRTGLPLNESSGFVPDNRFWMKKFGHLMTDGQEALLSIGQGMIEVTPVQTARMMAAVGNGRRVMKARLVRQIQDENNNIVEQFKPASLTSLNINKTSLNSVRRGLYCVVNTRAGTGRDAYHKITVAGKTGTGQWRSSTNQNVAWFAGYFPVISPRYSFAVVVEGEPDEEVGGGKTAAPLIGLFLDRYLTEENYNRIREESLSASAR